MIAYIGRFNDGAAGFKKGEYVAEAKLNELVKQFPDSDFIKINTSTWSQHPFSMAHRIIKAFFKCDDLIFHCSGNSFEAVQPIIVFNNLFLKKKVHYVGYGNDFESYIHGFVKRKSINRIKHWYVETQTIKNALQELGFNNVTVLYNFRHYQVLTENDINILQDDILNVCIYSRITARKGISDAINAINMINKDIIKYELDIYGPIDDEYKKEFESIIKGNEHINYKGVVSPDEAIDTLRKYDYLLFPTGFLFEGFPGTVIDAYSAALPIISSNFMSAFELIKNGETGYIYDFNNCDDLKRVLITAYDNREKIFEMKKECLKLIKQFDPEKAIIPLMRNLSDFQGKE